MDYQNYISELKEQLNNSLSLVKIINDNDKDNDKDVLEFTNAQLYIEQAIGMVASYYIKDISNSINSSTTSDPISILLESNPLFDNNDNDNDFKKVSHKRKSKNTMVNQYKIHTLEIKQGMYIDAIKNHYDIFNNINNRDDIINLKFYFKDADYFDKRGGLYVFAKGNDIYYICENKKLYKIDKNNNLVEGKYDSKIQVWKDINDT